MSQETNTGGVRGTRVETGTGGWVTGMLGGLAGGTVMGILLSILMPSVIQGAIPALVGLQGGLAGWIVHMVISAILGVVFAVVVSVPALGRFTDSIGPSAVLGLVYGVVLWVLLAALLMPVWLSGVRFGMAPPFPNFALPGSLPAHIVYGIVLGALYPSLRNLSL
jgi:hypothetical protein